MNMKVHYGLKEAKRDVGRIQKLAETKGISFEEARLEYTKKHERSSVPFVKKESQINWNEEWPRVRAQYLKNAEEAFDAAKAAEAQADIQASQDYKDGYCAGVKAAQLSKKSLFSTVFGWMR